MVGFWYNKALFKKAGHRPQPPATWSGVPRGRQEAQGRRDHPDRAGRQGEVAGPLLLGLPGDAHRRAATPSSRPRWTTTSPSPTSSQAGQQLKELVDLQPFQKGFLGAELRHPDGQAATMANGKAAMELMGQWAPTRPGLRRQGARRRPRLLPLPGRRGRQGRDHRGVRRRRRHRRGRGRAAGGGRVPEVPHREGQAPKAVESGAVLPVLKGEEAR